MKKLNQWSGRMLLFGGIILGIVASFIWMAHSTLLGASPFFAAGAAYTFFLYRVVQRSGRAFFVMHCALFMISIPLPQAQDALGIPVGGSGFLGFWAGIIASGYPWSGKRSGPDARQIRDDNNGEVQGYTGGRDIALINAACIVFVLGCGLAHLAFETPTAPVAAVLVGSLVCGWAFFRFPPSFLTRNVLLLVIPAAEFCLLAFLTTINGQSALLYVWAYGTMAGVLLGGRYWSGPRLGQPRPPFNGQAEPKRKRRTVRRSQDRLKQEHTQNEVTAEHR
ncbi:hypothetical protein ACX800_21075 [Paenarthrobacter nitroguajacolicus]|uniref:hypothetical protein n=1 Tax=Paenarthrobacter nitroguajacolicus TaxID=211146 RepID=UPI003D2036F2